MLRKNNITDVCFVSRRWTYRGNKTGFEHFSDYLDNVKLINEAKFNRPYRLLKWLAERSQSDAYTSFSLSVELESFIYAVCRRSRLVHYFYGDYDLHYAPRMFGFIKVPVLASFHNPPGELKRRIKKTNFLKKLRGAVLLGNNQKAYFHDFCPEVPAEVIRHGVDCDFFKPLPENNIIADPTVLIVGGHLRDWELISRFLTGVRKAMPNIKAQFVIPSFLEKNIPKAEWIRNTHPVTDEELRAFYQTSSFLFFAPLDCVASNAVVEALACGLPIIAPEVGAIRDYVNNDCGYITKSGNVSEMISAAHELVSNHSLRRRMSLACRQQSLTLDWKVIREQYYDFYRRLGFIF